MKDSPTKTVCLINTNRGWGEREQWLFGAAKELKNRGHHAFMVTHLFSDLTTKCVEEDVSVFAIFVTGLSVFNPFKLMGIATTLKQHKVDMIMINLYSDLKLAALAAKLGGVRRIVVCREGDGRTSRLLKGLNIEYEEEFENIRFI